MSEIRKVPASAGAQWLLDAFSLFRRAPLQLGMLGVSWMLVTTLILLLAQMLPGWLGLAVQLASFAVGPLMFGGMLWAVGEIDQGRPARTSHLLQPIRDRRVSHLLVPLAVQFIAVVLLGTLLFMLIGREGFDAFSDVMAKMQQLQQSGQQISQDEAVTLMASIPVKRIALWVLIGLATFIALSMAMFTQPALVMQLAMTTVIMPLYVGSVYAAWKQMFAHRGRKTPPPVADHVFEA